MNVVRIMNAQKMAEYSPVCSLGDGNPTDLDLEYMLKTDHHGW